MKEYIGKVIEVFIPTNENTNIMNSNEIGFKVQMDNDIIEIVEEQNEYNSNIYKNDLVIIRKQTISNKIYYDIELYSGDYYE